MPSVILFRGKAGVGKSTISSEVSKIMKLPLIRKDDFYDTMARDIPEHETRNKICNAMIYRMVETNFSCGVSVIVDTSWHYLNQALKFREWVLGQNVQFQSVVCICSDEQVWAERLYVRKNNPKPNNIITDFDELKRHYGDLNTEPMAGELILDTAYPVDVLVEKVMRQIYFYN